jgi:hypothetical protein
MILLIVLFGLFVCAFHISYRATREYIEHKRIIDAHFRRLKFEASQIQCRQPLLIPARSASFSSSDAERGSAPAAPASEFNQ